MVEFSLNVIFRDWTLYASSKFVDYDIVLLTSSKWYSIANILSKDDGEIDGFSRFVLI